jgi:hypothetical protein
VQLVAFILCSFSDDEGARSAGYDFQYLYGRVDERRGGEHGRTGEVNGLPE